MVEVDTGIGFDTAVIPVLLLVDALALFVLRFDAVRLEDVAGIVAGNVAGNW